MAFVVSAEKKDKYTSHVCNGNRNIVTTYHSSLACHLLDATYYNICTSHVEKKYQHRQFQFAKEYRAGCAFVEERVELPKDAVKELVGEDLINTFVDSEDELIGRESYEGVFYIFCVNTALSMVRERKRN